MTEGETDVAVQSLQDFKYWFIEHFFAKDKTSAIVLPVHQPDASCRDEPLPYASLTSCAVETMLIGTDRHMDHNMFTSSGLSSLIGLPSLVAPCECGDIESLHCADTIKLLNCLMNRTSVAAKSIFRLPPRCWARLEATLPCLSSCKRLSTLHSGERRLTQGD